ncbi:hypothetical protein U3516DRAFT_823917 [Neocallimastix sp. 'constans']
MLNYGKTITLNILVYLIDRNYKFCDLFKEEFKNYTRTHNLDIDVNFNLFTNNNSTLAINDFGSAVEYLLKKGSSKYDLYIIDNNYVLNYAPYLMDLKEYIPNEVLSIYNSNIINNYCIFKNKLIGMPIRIAYNVLYSNIKYLKKYNKTIPKTWNEMMDTGEYILNREKELNNTDLIGYNGLFSDSECIVSFSEIIYSHRKSVNSTFPDLKSDEAIKALETIKEIKNRISSDTIFLLDDGYTIFKLLDGKALFLKFFIFNGDFLDKIMSLYQISPLPGSVEGITGSTVVGYNVGISKKIKPEKVKAAIEAVKYMSSKVFQKKMTMKNFGISCIDEFYEDEEVCEKTDCTLYLNSQFTVKPIHLTSTYEYVNSFKKYLYEFLYGKKSAKEVLRKIIDITEIHYLSIHSENAYIGIIILFIFTITHLTIILSLIFLFIKDYDPYFNFFSSDSWLLINIGIIFLLYFGFIKLGKLNLIKCFLKVTFLTYGTSFLFIPILYKLIINFPDNNKFISLVKKHKCIFHLFFFMIDTVLNFIIFINSFKIVNIIIKDGQNFQICKIDSTIDRILIYFEIIYKIFLVLAISILCFAEWNIQSTYYNIRYIMTVIYITVIFFILFLLLEVIRIKNFIANIVIGEFLIYTMVLSNYMLLYGYRVITVLIRRRKDKLVFIKNVTKQFIENEYSIYDEIKKKEEEELDTIEEDDTIIKSCKIQNDKTLYLNSLSNTKSNKSKSSNNKPGTNSGNKSLSIMSKLIGYHNTKDSSEESNK